MLYFTEPDQLVRVFRSLAAQSLASLVHIEQLRLPLEALRAGVAQAKERVEKELQVLQEQVSAPSTPLAITAPAQTRGREESESFPKDGNFS